MGKFSRLSPVWYVSALLWTLASVRLQAAPDNAPASGPRIIDSSGEDPKNLPAEGWHTERPPYPYQARATHEQGSMHVVITTGPNGRVNKVVILSAQAHPILDVSTAKWAYIKWYGPPNHRAKIPVTYILR